jgi:hypothetical protein
MESFNDLLIRWQPFFTAGAGVAATLAGLLFVSLSINRDRIAAPENHVLLRLAQRSFGDLIFTLFISLMFLVPNHHPYGLIIPLFFIAATRGCWFINSFYRWSKRTTKKSAAAGALREQVFQILAYLGLLITMVGISRGNLVWTFLLVPVIALLLYNASMNAWLLLIMETSPDDKHPA